MLNFSAILSEEEIICIENLYLSVKKSKDVEGNHQKRLEDVESKIALLHVEAGYMVEKWMNVSMGEIDYIKVINDTVDEHYEIIIEQSHTDLIRDTNDTTENLLIETEDIIEEIT